MSYLNLSPKKSEKSFNFKTTKPVLIFTADKPKENKKEKNNINLDEVKRRIYYDNISTNKDNLLTEVPEYITNKPKLQANNNTNNNQNGKKKLQTK